MTPSQSTNRRPVFQKAARGLKTLFHIFPSYFLRLRIAHKLLLGYLFLVVVVFAISAFAMVNLRRLNAINNSILKADAIINTTDKMIDAVLSQEFYAQRYMVLKTPEMLEGYWDKDKEFKQLAGQIRESGMLPPEPIKPLKPLHRRYSDTLRQVLLAPGMPESDTTPQFDRIIKKRQDELIQQIKTLQAASFNIRKHKSEEINAVGHLAFQTSALLCLVGVLISALAALLITRNISSAVNQLKEATHMIAEGRFDYTTAIVNQDELGELSVSFEKMAARLKQLEQTNLDCNPLTRLPGGITIEKNLQQRIEKAQPIAFMLADIDNFKAYNDLYGYARGNELIMATAELIDNVVKTHGSPADFVGHIGGDDFVLITDPACFEKIGHQLIDRFDHTVPRFYDEQSRRQGFIISENRQGRKTHVPLATISIAVVTNTRRTLDNPILFGEIAAEMKRFAKSKPGSVCVADQRSDRGRQDAEFNPDST